MKIKEKLRQFGILVIRLLWPGKASKGAQRVRVLIIGVGLMIGVTQAGPIQQFVAASLFGEGNKGANADSKATATFDNGSVKNLGSNLPSAAGTTQKRRSKVATSIVDLVGDSEVILRGTVKELTDGIENGVPYTEVKMQVTESIRGKLGKEYTFRQFGLIEPRKMGNGKVNLNVTPADWAKYERGEDVVLFLYKKGAKTGLRTTAGLGQGKVALKGGNAESQFGNVGLFEDLEADQKLMNDRDKRLLATKKGPVNADSFMSFVRRAVQNKWVEGGKLRHANKK